MEKAAQANKEQNRRPDMRILLVVDGSSYSDMETKMLEALRPPPQTEITVLTVVPEHTFLGSITLGKQKPYRN